MISIMINDVQPAPTGEVVYLPKKLGEWGRTHTLRLDSENKTAYLIYPQADASFQFDRICRVSDYVNLNLCISGLIPKVLSRLSDEVLQVEYAGGQNLLDFYRENPMETFMLEPVSNLALVRAASLKDMEERILSGDELPDLLKAKLGTKEFYQSIGGFINRYATHFNLSEDKVAKMKDEAWNLAELGDQSSHEGITFIDTKSENWVISDDYWIDIQDQDYVFSDELRAESGDQKQFYYNGGWKNSTYIWELALTDNQDAINGPEQYDLVGYLRDLQVIINESLVEDGLTLYAQTLGRHIGADIDLDRLKTGFDAFTIIRCAKHLGRVWAKQVVEREFFRFHAPQAASYLVAACKNLQGYDRLKIAAEHMQEEYAEN